MKKLAGMVNATITPMMENGTTDPASVAGLCKYLAENGVPALYPNGTNGESLLLDRAERQELAEAFVEGNAGRCTIYIQCGALTGEETFAHVRHAKAIKADGAGIMTPVFFPIDETGMEQLYDEILTELPDYPLYLYNIPSRSGNEVSTALLARLMDRHSNLQGIKFSSPDLLRINQYIRCCERTPDVLIGCDTLALSCLMLGGAGYVSGPGAVFPKTYTRIYDTFVKGDFEGARQAQTAVMNLQKGMDGIPEIPAIKYMLWKKDVIRTPVCRRPLRPLDTLEKDRLDQLLRAFPEA